MKDKKEFEFSATKSTITFLKCIAVFLIFIFSYVSFINPKIESFFYNKTIKEEMTKKYGSSDAFRYILKVDPERLYFDYIKTKISELNSENINSKALESGYYVDEISIVSSGMTSSEWYSDIKSVDSILQVSSVLNSFEDTYGEFDISFGFNYDSSKKYGGLLDDEKVCISFNHMSKGPYRNSINYAFRKLDKLYKNRVGFCIRKLESNKP